METIQHSETLSEFLESGSVLARSQLFARQGRKAEFHENHRKSPPNTGKSPGITNKQQNGVPPGGPRAAETLKIALYTKAGRRVAEWARRPPGITENRRNPSKISGKSQEFHENHRKSPQNTGKSPGFTNKQQNAVPPGGRGLPKR